MTCQWIGFCLPKNHPCLDYSEGVYLQSNRYYVLLDRATFEATIQKYEGYLQGRNARGKIAFEKEQKENTIQIMEVRIIQTSGGLITDGRMSLVFRAR